MKSIFAQASDILQQFGLLLIWNLIIVTRPSRVVNCFLSLINCDKLKLVTVDRSSSTGATNVNMDGSALEETHLFKLFG